MVEKRIDPTDGKAYSYEEVAAHYYGTYKKKEIQQYWDQMKPAAQAKAKVKSKAQPKAKADAKAEANSNTSLKILVGSVVKAKPPGKAATYTGKVVKEEKNNVTVDFTGLQSITISKASIITIDSQPTPNELKRLEMERKANWRKATLYATQFVKLNKKFPPDTRVKAQGITSPFIPDGSRGTVKSVDKRNLILVDFDDEKGYRFVPDSNLRLYEPMPILQPPVHGSSSWAITRIAKLGSSRDVMHAALRGLSEECKKKIARDGLFVNLNCGPYYGQMVVVEEEAVTNGVAKVKLTQATENPVLDEILKEDRQMLNPVCLKRGDLVVPAAALQPCTEEEFLQDIKTRWNEEQEAKRQRQEKEAQRQQAIRDNVKETNDKQRAIQQKEAEEESTKEDTKAQRFRSRMQDVDEWSAVTVEIQMVSGSVLSTLKLAPDVAVIDVRKLLIMQGSDAEPGLLKHLLHGGANLVTDIGVCDGSGTEAGKMLLGDLMDNDRKVVLKAVLTPVPCAGEIFHCAATGGDQWCSTHGALTVSFDDEGHNATVQWEGGYSSERAAGCDRGEMEAEVYCDVRKIRIKKKRGRKAYRQSKQGNAMDPYLNAKEGFSVDTDAFEYISGVVEMEAEHSPENGLKFEDLPKELSACQEVKNKWLQRTDKKPESAEWTIKV